MSGGLRFVGKRRGGKSDGVQVDNAEHSRYGRRDAAPASAAIPTLTSGIARACKTVRKAAATLRATCRSSTRISIIIYYTRVRHTDTTVAAPRRRAT